jgi:hypothetical protein
LGFIVNIRYHHKRKYYFSKVDISGYKIDRIFCARAESWYGLTMEKKTRALLRGHEREK